MRPSVTHSFNSNCANQRGTATRKTPPTLVAHQHFAQGKNRDADKWAFMNDLPNRRVADGLLVLCGETNIAKMEHHSEFTDSFGFTNRLREMNIGPILNPIHDYMPRHFT